METTVERASYRDQVTIVARALDVLRPDWVTRLTDQTGDDLRDLDVADVERCVLDAVFGWYMDGIHVLSGYLTALGGSSQTISDAIACDDDENDLLRQLWLEQVDARRG